MKRNNLTTALVAGIAGVAGIASVSTAVNLNSDGVGQVLIYPYYTVNNEINTLLSVVNTTEDVKAVKVRFLEGKNSRECLDFNLYLSPYDVWVAQLKATPSSVVGHVGENSVVLTTPDTSCTVPSISGQEFLPYGYDPQDNANPADGYDRQGTDLSRCTEGHFEIIEMGTVLGGDAAAATHTGSGSPASCATIVGNWVPGVGKWLADPTINMDAPDGSGGLFGSTTLVSVNDGVAMTYNADAIQSYSTLLQHTSPGDTIPSIITGNDFQSIVFYNGVAVTTDWLTNSAQAISALYMHENVYNEYVIDNDLNAETEWVLTFPTKFAYVDAVNSIGPVPYEPYTRSLAANGTGACEPYAVTGVYNREEATTPLGNVIPSPRPPGQVGAALCWETNVLEFHDALDVFGSSKIFGSNHNTAFNPGFSEGWTSLTFSQSTNDNLTGTTYTGLPVTGFSAQKFQNGALPSGTLANFAGLFTHRFAKNIQ